MRYVSFLLHLYQPPTQLGFVVDDIAHDCYEPLVDIFDSEMNPRFTLNMNFSLTEQLQKRGHEKILKGLRAASERGTLEFVDSGAYHPIFPLIPETEVRRQLEMNRRKNQEILGPSYAPKGVFPPEMCFSGHLAQTFHEMGYTWCITDDLPYTYHSGPPPFDFIPTMNQVRIFLRSNTWSNELSFHMWKGKEFVKKLGEALNEWFGSKDGYIIIAMDGETFGHHHKYYEEKFLRSLIYSIRADSDLEMVTLSELVERFPGKPQYVPPSTWSASTQDLCNDDPYPLWHSKFNPIHHNQWVLTNHVMGLALEASKTDPHVRELLDMATYSCQYWWASAWNFDPSQIFRGAFLLLDTLEKAGTVLGNREAVRVGRELYNNLVFSIAERIHGKK